MGKLITLIVFVVVVAVLWWALTQVLTVFAVAQPFATLAVVAFVVILVLAAADYLMNGTWFWRRP